MKKAKIPKHTKKPLNLLTLEQAIDTAAHHALKTMQDKNQAAQASPDQAQAAIFSAAAKHFYGSALTGRSFLSTSSPTQNKLGQKFTDGSRVVLYSPNPKFISDSVSNPYYPDHVSGEMREGIPLPIIGIVRGRNDADELCVVWPSGKVNTYGKSGINLLLESEWEKKFLENEVVVEPDFSKIDRLILSPEKKEAIMSVIKQFKHRKKIFVEWNLQSVIEYGRGMTMLFHGMPGTGKTWAAKCIADSIGRNLMVMDNAKLQSSSPGEMERNIKKAFTEAAINKDVLMFDECDSLLMTRSNVGMILGSEINCLLTEIEKFEGICILTTNRVGELDEALERRISLIVKFPKPNLEHRKEIWTRMLPKELPLAEDVTVEKLAEFKLTGGIIKNVLLNAVRLAVSKDKEKVDMQDFERALEMAQSGSEAFEEEGRAPTTHVRRGGGYDIVQRNG